MKNNKKADFQKEFDVKKWVESEAVAHDKCGEYEFCDACDKSLTDPCAEAHAKKEGASLKESIAIAQATKGCEEIDKKFVADHLEKVFGKAVLVNRRADKISSGLLPLADTHYIAAKKACFVYVYALENGGVMLLVKASDEFIKKAQKTHDKIFPSAFPRAKKTWYTVIVDGSFDRDTFRDFLNDLVKDNA